MERPVEKQITLIFCEPVSKESRHFSTTKEVRKKPNFPYTPIVFQAHQKIENQNRATYTHMIDIQWKLLSIVIIIYIICICASYHRMMIYFKNTI